MGQSNKSNAFDWSKLDRVLLVVGEILGHPRELNWYVIKNIYHLVFFLCLSLSLLSEQQIKLLLSLTHSKAVG